MSKLFAVTGQNNKNTAGKRAIDTEILLREAQSQPYESQRYLKAVARMNYLHARYRKAGKILDADMLHTLGDGLAEIINVVNETEWRKLSDVELCALGIFHRTFGDDLQIPYDRLPSFKDGWRDGKHFGEELVAWTVQYEQEVAVPSEQSDRYVRVYIDSGIPPALRGAVRRTIGLNLDNTMREALR